LLKPVGHGTRTDAEFATHMLPRLSAAIPSGRSNTPPMGERAGRPSGRRTATLLRSFSVTKVQPR
jgi:hypothetical protein